MKNQIMLRGISILLLIIGVSKISFSQNGQVATSKYSRNSVSVHFLNFNGSQSLLKNDYIESSKSLTIPDKFDNNIIDTKLLNVNGSNIFEIPDDPKVKAEPISNKLEDFEKTDGYKVLLDALYSNRTPNKVLKSIIIGKDGAFSSTEIFKRAEYNATDAQVISAQNSNNGLSEIQTTGFNLLNNVYFIVDAPRSFKKTKSLNKETNETLYSAKVTSYLFKLELDQNTFWNDFYFEKPDAKKLENMMNFKFNVKLVSISDVDGISSDKVIKTRMDGLKVVTYYVDRPEDQIYDQILSQILNASIFAHTKKYDGFKVKTSIFNVGPIQAKIGKKESVKIDDLFEISENKLKKDGDKFVKNIGWVRAKTVIDNAKNADGKSETSTFYEIYGGAVKKGMVMKEVPETGVVVGMAYDIPTSQNSVAGGPIVQIDYITHISPGSRIGLGLGGFRTIETKSVELNGALQKYNLKGSSFYGDLTYQKIIQLKMIEFTPYAGAYFSGISVSKLIVGGKDYDLTKYLPTGSSITTTDIGGLIGFKAGINLGKHLQLNMGYKLGFEIVNSTKYSNSNESTNSQNLDINAKYDSPSCLSFGIRLFGF